MNNSAQILKVRRRRHNKLKVSTGCESSQIIHGINKCLPVKLHEKREEKVWHFIVAMKNNIVNAYNIYIQMRKKFCILYLPRKTIVNAYNIYIQMTGLSVKTASQSDATEVPVH